MKIFYIINRQILMILNEIKELIKVARVLLKKKIIAYDNKSELFSLYTMTWKGPTSTCHNKGVWSGTRGFTKFRLL